MSQFKPFELSTTLWAIAKLSSLQGGSMCEDRSVFVTAAKQIKARAHEYGFRCLATVAWAYATARDFNLSLFQAISAQMVPLASTANCQEVANTVWAFGTADFHDPALFEALAEHAALRLEEFKPQEISNTLWGFATNSYFHDVFYARASQVVQNMDPQLLQPQHLANVLWAFSRVRPRHVITQQIILALLPLCMAQLDSFKPQEVSSTLLAIAKAMSKAEDADTSGPELWQIHGKVSTYFESCVSWILPRLNEFSVQSLANTVSAFAFVPVQGAGMLLEYVSAEVKHRCSVCDVSTKVHLLKGYALLPSPQFDDVRVMLAHGILAELGTVRQQELHGLARSLNIIPSKARGGGKQHGGENLQEEVRKYLVAILQHKQLPAAPRLIDDSSDNTNFQTTSLREESVASQTLGKEAWKHQSRGRGRMSLPAREFAQHPPLCTIDEASSVSTLAVDLHKMAENHVNGVIGQKGFFNPQNPPAWIQNGLPGYAEQEQHLREQQVPLGGPGGNSVEYNLSQLAAQMRLAVPPAFPTEHHPYTMQAPRVQAPELESTPNGSQPTAPFVNSGGFTSQQQGPLVNGGQPTDANSPNLMSMLANLMNNNNYPPAMIAPLEAAQVQTAFPFNPAGTYSTQLAPSYETTPGDMYAQRPDALDYRLSPHMGSALASSLGAAQRQQGMHPAAGALNMNTDSRPSDGALMTQQQAFGSTGPSSSLLTSAMLAARPCSSEMGGGLTQQALAAQLLAAQNPGANLPGGQVGLAQPMSSPSGPSGMSSEAQKRGAQTIEPFGSHYATSQNPESRQLLSSQMLAAARLGMTQPLSGCSQLGSTRPTHMSGDGSEPRSLSSLSMPHTSPDAGSSACRGTNQVLNNLMGSQFMALQNMGTGVHTSSLGLPMDMRSTFPTSPEGDKQTVEYDDADEQISRSSNRIDERTRRLIVKNSFLHVEDSDSDKEEEPVECNSSVRSSSMPSSIGRESRGARNLPSSEILQMLARFNSSQTPMPSNDAAM
eukprot:TRINITY_DN5048_c0_g1_i1.p1 TRINITY_DN5048_c0_g1~~TRINITY_DN5048_c0_g1_i1.p1  ORF type:complete len:1163 (+),score=169.80 TRINITY_DN5048_c0_g1_i1:481-3489(+)